MQYYDFKDLKLSALGFGAMRLPVIDGDDAAVDETATFEMVDYAYEAKYASSVKRLLQRAKLRLKRRTVPAGHQQRRGVSGVVRLSKYPAHSQPKQRGQPDGGQTRDHTVLP